MKKILLLLAIVAFYGITEAQTIAKDSIFTSPEIDAEFPDGIQAFFHFFGQNMKYPQSAVRTLTTGKVMVSFVVETNGKLDNITIVKGISPEMDKEALRVVALSPKWNPAKQSKQKVRAKYTFPVQFYLPPLPVINDGLDTIYATADEPPKYEPGEDELMKFIEKNLRNPFNSVPDHIKGNSNIAFVVEKDGSLTHIGMVTSPNEAMKIESIRLIKALPGKFIAAKQNGVAVRGQYMVVIPF